MLKQHKYYVYYEGGVVFARMDARPRVVVKTCGSPQEAHDYVQSVVNPNRLTRDDFGHLGFHHPDFQDAISDNCASVVLAAYEGGSK